MWSWLWGEKEEEEEPEPEPPRRSRRHQGAPVAANVQRHGTERVLALSTAKFHAAGMRLTVRFRKGRHQEQESVALLEGDRLTDRLRGDLVELAGSDADAFWSLAYACDSSVLDMERELMNVH